MKYNFFQEGGEDETGADFFNGLLDMGMQQQEQEDYQEEQAPIEEPEENDFIKGLSEYATETQNSDLQAQLDELKAQIALSREENALDANQQDLEEQIALAQYYQTPDGEDELMGKYDIKPINLNLTNSVTQRYIPSTESLQESIAKRESGGNYKAFTSAGGGQGAVGKYQFRWNLHKDWIKGLTGVKTIEDFKNNPEAQEKAFSYWDKTTLTPTALGIQQTLQKLNKAVPSLDEIKKKVHFAGEKGARDYYVKGKETTDAFGTKTSTYAMGGYVNSFEGGRMAIKSNKKKKYSC